MLNRLKEVGLTLNGDKCEFMLPRLTFFGHQVTQNGVEPRVIMGQRANLRALAGICEFH